MSKNEQTNPLVQNIKKISLSLIDDFPNHPYRIIDDESMAELTESIRKNGLISPVIVRKKDGGRYELISGHHRKYACSVLGYEEIRCNIISATDATVSISNIETSSRIIISALKFRQQLSPSSES